MQLVVVHEDGQTERLTLLTPFTVICGKSLDRIVEGTGIEHWFTKDGFYDGWGKTHQPPLSDQDSDDVVSIIESSREYLE